MKIIEAVLEEKDEESAFKKGLRLFYFIGFFAMFLKPNQMIAMLLLLNYF